MSEEKTESNSVFSMVKLGLVLAAFAVVSCALLAVVNNVTSPVIAQNQVKKANEKMKAVFADADDPTRGPNHARRHQGAHHRAGWAQEG